MPNSFTLFSGRAATRLWGIVTIPGLLVGYGIINNGDDAYLALGVASLGIGFVGFFVAILSSYHRNRRWRETRLDERQMLILQRANGYAYAGLAICVLLIMLYARIALQPERDWWFPQTGRDWSSLILPVALILPLLPAIIAEWLDPIAVDDEG